MMYKLFLQQIRKKTIPVRVTVLIVQIHLKTMVQKMIRINQIQPINQMILIKIVMGKTQVNKIRLVQMIV